MFTGASNLKDSKGKPIINKKSTIEYYNNCWANKYRPISSIVRPDVSTKFKNNEQRDI